jgi:alanyl aminopeptidase
MRSFVAVAVVACAVSLLVACGAEPPAQPQTGAGGAATTGAPVGPNAAAGAPAPRDDGRLPPTATPLRYSLALEIDPGKPRFSGRVRILVSIEHATQFIVLHGRDLHLTSIAAHLQGRAIAGLATPRVAHGGSAPEELVLTFAEKLPAGQATIEIAYDAPFSSTLGGLYRVNDADRWYAFTQFQATDARRAFPCFDEPGFKTAFDISITAPKGLIAIANAPETIHKDVGASTTFGFATTRPLPTYLVALAVGDFDVRPAPASPIPLRLVATKGKAQLGGPALEATQALTALLADYFGIRYPYEKLDIVAVPDFAAGAMENAGLITFQEELLLIDPKTITTRTRRDQALVIAHELAHQWFGNLVTMQWWDDLWLNEGFATWMEAKIVDKWRPTFGARLERLVGAQDVMDTDALKSARAVRQPVNSTDEAMEAFDGITYQKGAAVLGMIESWIGEDVFQKGVRDYLRANAWKNAKAEDLLRALDLASNKDVSKVASSFLDKPGVPAVSVTASCDKKEVQLAIKQTPWHPLGGAAAANASWTIPTCMRAEGTKGDVCAIVGPETATKELPGAKCPALG